MELARWFCISWSSPIPKNDYPIDSDSSSSPKTKLLVSLKNQKRAQLTSERQPGQSGVGYSLNWDPNQRQEASSRWAKVSSCMQSFLTLHLHAYFVFEGLDYYLEKRFWFFLFKTTALTDYIMCMCRSGDRSKCRFTYIYSDLVPVLYWYNYTWIEGICYIIISRMITVNQFVLMYFLCTY